MSSWHGSKVLHLFDVNPTEKVFIPKHPDTRTKPQILPCWNWPAQVDSTWGRPPKGRVSAPLPLSITFCLSPAERFNCLGVWERVWKEVKMGVTLCVCWERTWRWGSFGERSSDQVFIKVLPSLMGVRPKNSGACSHHFASWIWEVSSKSAHGSEIFWVRKTMKKIFPVASHVFLRLRRYFLQLCSILFRAHRMASSTNHPWASSNFDFDFVISPLGRFLVMHTLFFHNSSVLVSSKGGSLETPCLCGTNPQLLG